MITDHLLTLSKNYRQATEHEFLHAIGNGTASSELLSLWLSQDRIYAAHAYPRFIAHLITHIPFSSSDAIASPRENANKQLLGTLSFCIQNVVNEAQFFLRTAEKYGLDLDSWAERKETKEYVDTMLRIASESTLEEGLVFLWAMEKVRRVLTFTSLEEQRYHRCIWMHGPSLVLLFGRAPTKGPAYKHSLANL